MNNLHRELAPISDAAWAQIEEETSRTLKRYLAGRRVVDVQGPAGTGLSAVGTGHLRTIAAPRDGIIARQREVKALVELRVPFELDRQAIDDVERGANDSDWQPAKDAARQIAFAEDGAIFEGYAAAGIVGIRQGTSNPMMTLPADVRQYPEAIAQALSQLRLVGVNGPYAVLLGADAYTALAETSDHGYPVLEHVKRLVDDKIIWAPAIAGAFVLTTRGGDFDLHIGQDVSIGYSSHTDDRRPPVPAGDIHVPAAHRRGRRRADSASRKRRRPDNAASHAIRSCHSLTVVAPMASLKWSLLMTTAKSERLSLEKIRGLASAAPPCISIVLPEREARDARRALERFDKLIGTGHASADVEEIVRAASTGRVEHLFLLENGAVLGAVGGGSDLLDTAAVQTLRHGGDVQTLPEASMHSGGPICAIFRYASESFQK